MYRLIKKIVYLFTFYCCLDFLFFDFPVPAVSFPMLWYSSMYSFSSFTSFGSKEMKPVFLK